MIFYLILNFNLIWFYSILCSSSETQTSNPALLRSWTVVCPSFTLLMMLLLPGWPTMGLNRICKKKKMVYMIYMYCSLIYIPCGVIFNVCLMHNSLYAWHNDRHIGLWCMIVVIWNSFLLFVIIFIDRFLWKQFVTDYKVPLLETDKHFLKCWRYVNYVNF